MLRSTRQSGRTSWAKRQDWLVSDEPTQEQVLTENEEGDNRHQALIAALDSADDRERRIFEGRDSAVPENFLGVMGMPINSEGEIESENLTLACRNATLNMMALLQERGYTPEQAYVICSVAVDLRVSNVVDVPNYVVSALLPLTIFG